MLNGSTRAKKRQCTGQFFDAGELLEYCGAPAPEGFILPEGIEIIPWEHPMLFWLTIKGMLVAGPAKREVLESYVFQNQDHLLDLLHSESFR